MANSIKQKSAVAGLRCVQTLGTLAVPSTLEEVPEEVENKPESAKPEIFGTDDWKRVEHAVNDIFKKEFSLNEQGILFNLHQNVKNILRSRTGTFLFDCYKEWLNKEMTFHARKIRDLEGQDLLRAIEDTWISFYTDTLPTLEALFYQIKPKGRVSVRGSTLVAFRDHIFFAENIEDTIKKEIENLTPELRHMILILYTVHDTYPPSKNKLRLEALAAKTCESFMGYLGLYKNGELIVPSNEPAIVSRRRPSADVGPRRISRPFNVQPQQMETLNQLFRNAVKHKSARYESNRGNFQKKEGSSDFLRKTT